MPVPSPDEKGGGLCVGPAPRRWKTKYATETRTTATQNEDLRYRPGGERMKQRNLRTNLLSSKNVPRIGFWNVRTLYESEKGSSIGQRNGAVPPRHHGLE
ncbi:hypothetical protein DPMN_005062 [Dreissena polymorpha]|uniref:Uncharacterized protein n=1 Tax=Dreissena polymorpha TaxID=45954 RepID=A0A9D4MSR8_DREPO|nr:hypothetical protein DPMN_005062 [Dreissena polymorpha]